MRRLFLITFIIAATLSSKAQTIGKEMYIYRNNGQVTGFLSEEVQSIGFSNRDSEGEHNEYVTQLIYTNDSTYEIPLAEIDSISFVTPKTVFKQGVTNISDQLIPYIVSSSVDPLVITFSSSTPTSLMPQVGDKLVMVEDDEKFPAGFAGEVTSVNGTVVSCELVSLEDIFETYSCVSSTYGYHEETNDSQQADTRAVNMTSNKNFKLGTFKWSKSSELEKNLFENDDLALDGGTELAISVAPSFHIISTLIINKEMGTYFSASIIGDLTFKESVSAYGSIDWSKDFLDKEWFSVPLAGKFINFYVSPGLFLNAFGKVSASATWTQKYRWVGAFDFSTKKQNVIKPICDGSLVSASFDIDGAIEGRLAAGGFLEVGLSVLSKDISKLSLRGELGAELVGEAVLYNSDIAEATKNTRVYERLKNSPIQINKFVNAGLEAKLGPWEVSKSLPWELHENIITWDMVPIFAGLRWKRDNSQKTTANVKTLVGGNCLIPVDIGISVRDRANNEIGSYYSPEKYKSGGKIVNCTFNGLSEDEHVELYPKIKLFGYEMLAKEQENDLCPDGNHPHMIDLGLPSGTLWACCNVDASFPEECGGYYAWGETKTKEIYDWNTYQYGHYLSPTNHHHTFGDDIGLDIAGTSYDAAKANWETPWTMPSIEQCEELAEYTTIVLCTHNGIQGTKFKGSNGNTIFLPRAGFYTTEGFRQEKHSHGFFWSSTFIEDDLLDRDNPLAYAWAFGVGLYGRRNELLEARRDVEPRANGLPIRAVCNKDEISESK